MSKKAFDERDPLMDKDKYMELKFKVDIPEGWDEHNLKMWQDIKTGAVQLINQKLGSIKLVNGIWQQIRSIWDGDKDDKYDMPGHSKDESDGKVILKNLEKRE